MRATSCGRGPADRHRQRRALWSRSYDRRVEDVFAVQTDLTTQIVASLVSYVRQSEFAEARQSDRRSLRAYELVLQARERFQREDARSRRGCCEAQALYSSVQSSWTRPMPRRTPISA